MTSELAIMQQLKTVLVREYPNYKEDTDTTVLTTSNVQIDMVDIDRMRDDVGVWIMCNGITCDDQTFDEDDLNMTVTIALVCKRGESTALRDKIFNMKSAIYRAIRHNQSLDDKVDLVNVEGYTYFPEMFAELGIVGLDMNISIQYVEKF